MSDKKLRRYMAAGVLTVALLVPLAFYGGTGFAKNSSAAQYQYKLTICHHTGSKKHPMHTISVSNRAWPAHQRHGDTMGACPPPAPTTTTTPATTTPAPTVPTTTTTGPGNSGNHGNGNNGNGKAKGHDK
jgi:hypothetical protein